MTVQDSTRPAEHSSDDDDNGATTTSQQSLDTAAARNLATTTKSVPQMQGISSRWLLRMLPWVQAAGGAYRVNRRLTCTVGNGRVSFIKTGQDVRVVPPELRELALLREFPNTTVLDAMADRFTRTDYEPGDVIVEFGGPADQLVLLAHGKVNRIGPGEFGDQTVLEVLGSGDYFGDEALVESQPIWEATVKAVTSCTVLSLSRNDFQELLEQSNDLAEHVRQFVVASGRAANAHGEAAVDVASGHAGEFSLPGTFVDYEAAPREYELSVAQTVLRVHSRVADLYNNPMNQVEQQLRLTIEALRERQEHEMINNPEIGLLHNSAFEQRTPTRGGPPTPDDLDDLLAMVWKEPTFFLAHPRAIAAFGRECNKLGIYPQAVDIGGNQVPSWRGVPILPCNKIPISSTRTTSMLLVRAGEHNQGVIGLHQTGIPDEYRPGLSVRFMGIDEVALISYLVSAYYSVAVLVPDALGVLEAVELGRDS